jgi:hypothetical protein
LFLCQSYVGYPNGRVDLYGLFPEVTAPAFPHVEPQFCVVAQLTDGLGTVDFFIDIRYRPTGQLVHSTLTNQVSFRARSSIRWLMVTIRGCRFDQPGLYTVELFCNNQWICDTTLLVR